MTSKTPNQHGNGVHRRRSLLSCAVVAAILAVTGGAVIALTARLSASGCGPAPAARNAFDARAGVG